MLLEMTVNIHNVPVCSDRVNFHDNAEEETIQCNNKKIKLVHFGFHGKVCNTSCQFGKLKFSEPSCAKPYCLY